ncbi:hypothetical protein JZX87_09885 [Agrobacterium sp. Ap1]|uniref:hypothetical protein n=1 Tax=Agrobacterium sp. Ap1 TaxID=2815337 RepID=UPI001A9037CA|nr:hypothetical protein [Agrobacterium sp. Ap1]MBO0141472.1 hypothetical protein [Agrobacterium sp. Ap1]
MNDKRETRCNLPLLMAAAVVASAASTPSFAVTPLSPASCSSISDAVARLSCFDRLFPSPNQPVTSKLAGVCIERLKQSLKAPSTFQLVETETDSERLSIDEYKDHELIRIRDSYDADTASMYRALMIERVDALRTQVDAVTAFSVSISYDAQNAFGAMLRGKAHCSAVSTTDREDDVIAGTLTVESR